LKRHSEIKKNLQKQIKGLLIAFKHKRRGIKQKDNKLEENRPS